MVPRAIGPTVRNGYLLKITATQELGQTVAWGLGNAFVQRIPFGHQQQQQVPFTNPSSTPPP